MKSKDEEIEKLQKKNLSIFKDVHEKLDKEKSRNKEIIQYGTNVIQRYIYEKPMDKRFRIKTEIVNRLSKLETKNQHHRFTKAILQASVKQISKLDDNIHKVL